MKTEVPSGFVETVKVVNERTRDYLYDPGNEKVKDVLELFEKRTNLKREHLAYTLFALTALYFVIGSFAQIICNFVGFAYPAYESVKAIRSPTKEDDTKWLIYWTVFAFFSLVDFFANVIFCYFPFYYLFKILFLLYLYLPQTNGALFMYENYVDDFVRGLESNFAKKKSP
ncbi:Receptor expression-enhancing protein [Aphelenchoides besseyi]|nr:Receptor expression-enhancing protein [Aphelenchoides besseyi]KAI6201915.1 Receptor expression-enhancing protein [Aphelenchoides besseyi]